MASTHQLPLLIAGRGIVNGTPLTLTILLENGESISIPPSGTEIRVKEERTPALPLITEGGKYIPVDFVSYSMVTGLPDQSFNTFYLVSHLVAQACPWRRDLFYPGELVREPGTGKVLGCKGLFKIYSSKYAPSDASSKRPRTPSPPGDLESSSSGPPPGTDYHTFHPPQPPPSDFPFPPAGDAPEVPLMK